MLKQLQQLVQTQHQECKTIPIFTSIDLLTSVNLTQECLFSDYVIISSDTKFKQLSSTIYQNIQLKINKLNFKIFDCKSFSLFLSISFFSVYFLTKLSFFFYYLKVI
jgi:hypothetical protein